MKLSSQNKGKYTLISVEQEDDSIQELFELKDAIYELIENGVKNIAVRFSNISYIYSCEIRILISCYKMIHSAGGSFCIVEPKDSVRDILRNLKLDKIFEICESEQILELGPT